MGQIIPDCYIRGLGRFFRDGHSSLSGPFISYNENKVLRIWLKFYKIVKNIFLNQFENIFFKFLARLLGALNFNFDVENISSLNFVKGPTHSKFSFVTIDSMALS
jgi:hypothetical protein